MTAHDEIRQQLLINVRRIQAVTLLEDTDVAERLDLLIVNDELVGNTMQALKESVLWLMKMEVRP